MNLTAEQLAALPADVQEALALAGKPSKSAEELSKDAAMASYEAGKDPKKNHDAMLAHAKAHAAHKSEAADHLAKAEAAKASGDHETSAQCMDAGFKAEQRARHEANNILVHSQTALGNFSPISAVQGFSVAEAVHLASVDELLGAFVDSGTDAGLSDWLPVLYPGKWNDLPFTAAMIKEMAAGFNPNAESCPVKIGHEGDDTQPQLSQVRVVKVAPCTLTNGKTVENCLYVRMDRTPEALASLRQYRKTSIEAWPPQHQSNPTPGKWNLKGLAFLGAAAPAVSGLPPTHLSANSQGGASMPEPTVDLKAAQDQAAAALASLAQANNEAVRLKAANDELEAKLAAQAREVKAAAIRHELADFAQVFTPAQMQLLEPVALALESDEPTVKLSATQTVSPRTCLIALLQGIAKNRSGNGLTDPLNVQALSGKKPVDPDTEDESALSDEAFKAKKVKEFAAKDPKATMAANFAAADQALKERNKAKAAAKK